MTELDALAYASPEWAATDTGLQSSQYGASLTFRSQGPGTITLHFATTYPALRFTKVVNGQDQATLWAEEDSLSLSLPAAGEAVTLVLDQWQTGQVAFWQQGLQIRTIEFTGAAAPVPVQSDQPYFTFVGDSIVAGEAMTGPNHDQHQPSQSFPALVARAKQRPLARIAYGGTGLTVAAPFQEPTAIQALWQVGDHLPRPLVPTDTVVVAYGLNDANYGASANTFAFGLRVYLLELVKRFHHARMFLLTPWNGAFVDIFKQEAARFDCFTVVDTTDWGIATRPNHPDGAAHQRISEHILTLLEEEAHGLSSSSRSV
ncbi:GDSL-type esterase/lipase family protein [Leuconostocaceae bacterium ESL0958]|nr:GDSL-type esterase/lipase family protein [Leuconostocaceae bacterium ESL0958]